MKGENKILEKLLTYLIPIVFGVVFILMILMWFRAGKDAEAVERREKVQESSVAESEGQEELETEKPENEEVSQCVEEMTLEDKVAQLFIITPEALTGIDDVQAAGESTAAAYDNYPVGGLVYFENNIDSEDQLRIMLQKMQEIATERTGFPVFLSVDEEGGRVARVANHENFNVENPGAMYQIGETQNPQKAYDAGATIGKYLKSYGFNLTYAPVADVFENPNNQVIGDRAFSSDPKTAAAMVAKAVEGFESENMGTVIKHFPGHGNTEEDSHEGYAYNYKTQEELEKCEFLPFESGIQAGADMVMVGHISLPDAAGEDIPSTLSEKVVSGILRNRLKFAGVVVTDAMNMGAIANSYSSAEAAVKAVEAGCDMILMPADFEQAYQGILDAVSDGRIPEERIDESVERILKIKEEL